jgi:hypothetical protein
VGKTHDKTILDEASLDAREVNILADLGFLGMDKSMKMRYYPSKKLKIASLLSFKSL